MDAEQRLREYLTKQGIATTEVRRLSYTKLAAFAVVRGDGVAVNAVVEGDRVWVDEHSLDVVGKVLAARKFLEGSDLAENDLIFLVTAFGTVPPEIAGFGSYRQTKSVPGYPARIERQGGGAQLHLVIPRDGRARGATAEPQQAVYEAVLKISPSYAATWSVEATQVPLPVDS